MSHYCLRFRDCLHALVLRSMPTKILTIFGSTYNCEQCFSNMNRYRNIITNIHLNNVLRVAITSVKPDFSLSYIKEMSLQPARSGTEQSELVVSCTGMML